MAGASAPPAADRVPRRALAGGCTSSILGVSLTGAEGAPRSAALLRRLRSAGVTTFDLARAASPDSARTLLAEALTDPDPSVLVLAPKPASGAEPGISPARPASTGLAPEVGLYRWSPEGIATGGPSPSDRGAAPPVMTLRRVETTPTDLSGEPPALYVAHFSLLSPGRARAWDGALRGRPARVFVDDPFAGGRLDGTRFAEGSFAEGRPAPPPRIRDLESEFAPVLRLGFLTEGRRRTLAQAAIRFVTRWPWVASALVPLPRPERVDELLGAFGVPPLTDDEVERLEGSNVK